MRVVIDANILFAALLRKGMTRRLIFNSELKLLAPEFILKEFLKHKAYLLSKYGFGPNDFEKLLSNPLAVIELVPDKELAPYLPASKTLAADLKDSLYLAAALKENAIIWSNDVGFKKQRRIRSFTTVELAEELGLV